MSTPMSSRKLVIVGAGGAGMEALWVAQRSGEWEVLGFVDDAVELSGKTIGSLPVVGSIERVLQEIPVHGHWFYCAIGSNQTRRKITTVFEAKGWTAATLIDPSAVVAPSATVGVGSYVGAQVFVGPEAAIGRHVLMNVGSSIGHHTVLGDYAQVCPGSRISGNVSLGEGAFLGSNAVVTPGIAVGAWATVAAASMVCRAVPARCTAIGVPAKILAPPPIT